VVGVSAVAPRLRITDCDRHYFGCCWLIASAQLSFEQPGAQPPKKLISPQERKMNGLQTKWIELQSSSKLEKRHHYAKQYAAVSAAKAPLGHSDCPQYHPPPTSSSAVHSALCRFESMLHTQESTVHIWCILTWPNPQIARCEWPQPLGGAFNMSPRPCPSAVVPFTPQADVEHLGQHVTGLIWALSSKQQVPSAALSPQACSCPHTKR